MSLEAFFSIPSNYGGSILLLVYCPPQFPSIKLALCHYICKKNLNFEIFVITL